MTPAAPPRWGKMSPHQAICHLTDSFQGVIGERAISPATLWIPRSILKWLILNVSWPKNAPTRPEVDQFGGGTPPAKFEADRLKLLSVIDRFCDAPDSSRTPHPLLGNLSLEDWLRWG